MASTAAAAASRRVLVVGSGVIGLRTAVELVRRKIPVVLRSPKHPMDKSGCSQGAGGLWMPFHCDDPRTDAWSIQTLEELLPMGQDKENPLVEIVPAVALKRNHHGPTTMDMVHEKYHQGTGGASALPSWSTDPRIQFQNLTIEMLWFQNASYKLRIPAQDQLAAAGYQYAWFFHPPIVDSPNMLQSMLTEVQEASSDVDVETNLEYESLDHIMEDAKRLECHGGVVNCTGLGASKLCGDSQMVGARGVLLQYDRASIVRQQDTVETTDLGPIQMKHDAIVMAEEFPWGSEQYPCYMIARGDTIVVGGSYLEGDTYPKLRDEERQRLLENAHLMGIDISQTKPKGEWVGFRPYRPMSKCEVDVDVSQQHGIRLVHSYGYGGSGWTVYVGCAKEATQLLLDR